MKVIKKDFCESSRGEIMLESLLVFPMIVSLLFFILALFFVYFQFWNYNIVAEEIAMRVAQTYKYVDADLLTGELSGVNSIADLKSYRYFILGDSFKNSAQTKGQKIANSRMNTTTFSGQDTVAVKVNVKRDSLGRQHIEVDLTAKYIVPLGSVFDFFGLDNMTTCHVVTYADSSDMVYYMDMVDFVTRMTDFDGFEIITDIADLISSFVS